MRPFIALVAILLVAPLLLAVIPGATHAEPSSISVISYNVQFLPGLASSANKRKQPEYRAKRIAEEMAKFDIVALQETFNDNHRPLLIEALREQWNGVLNLVVAPMPEGFIANGGTIIATRWPIVASNACVYTEFSSPKDYGITADGYAAKGGIHARIELPGGSQIDVFNTHFEAREPKYRPSQYREFADFIAEHSDPALPALVVGDLNTRGAAEHRADPASLYNQLMGELRRARPGDTLIDTWLHLHPDANGGTTEQESIDIVNRIDYIIVINPANGPQLDPETVAINPYPDETVEYLSDHNAVLATLRPIQ